MIVLGRIVAPFGVHGWLKIHPFGDDPKEWLSVPRWWISPDADAVDEAWSLHKCEALKLHGEGVVAKFAGLDDRGSSEPLRGYFLGILHSELPKPKAGEYYWADLIGLRVVTLSNDFLGTVASLLESGANQVLVVVDGDTERLLPFVESVVSRVDLAEGMIYVDWGADW